MWGVRVRRRRRWRSLRENPARLTIIEIINRRICDKINKVEALSKCFLIIIFTLQWLTKGFAHKNLNLEELFKNLLMLS